MDIGLVGEHLIEDIRARESMLEGKAVPKQLYFFLNKN